MTGLNRREFLWNTTASVGGLLVLDTFIGCRPDEGILDPDGEWVPFADVHAGFPMTFTERVVPTTCWIGKQDCGMLARVLSQTVNGQTVERLVKLEGNPRHPRNLGKLCPKGAAQLQAVYDYNRIKWPLRRINPKGQPGRFVRVNWDEALEEVKTELDDALINSKPVLWQKGRSKAKGFYDTAFVKALGNHGLSASKVGHGAYCSDSGYRAAEYTLGYHGVISPDLAHTQYLLSWGWGLTTSGGNKHCWLTWPQKFLAARNREDKPLRKVVCLDPNRRQTGPHADEWLPNRPGSDLAFFLGIAHYLVNNTAAGYPNGLIDEEYLRSHSNAPSLVFSDPADPDFGKILKIADVEQVWNPATGAVADTGTAGVTPDLLGTYLWNDGALDHEVKPSFQMYKEHLAPYTPEWADQTTGLPELSTAQVARELFENAHIGETITLDGVTLPYRPVSMMAYHVSQQELGFSAIRSGINVFQLLGAIDCPGGIQVDFGPKGLYKNWEGLNGISVKTSDLGYTLGKSKYFPISSSCPSFFHRAQLDPERYDVDESTIPKKVILHMVDPAKSFTDLPTIRKAYSQFEHVTAITPWLSETADLFADLILPAATIEKHEGPISCSTVDEKADALRMPPIAPLWESKGEIDIYLDIAEKVGFLDDYIDQVNSALGLEAPNLLDTSSRPTTRTIFDNWAKQKGKSGIDYFEENGVTDISTRTADAKYSSASDYHGARHRLYGESLRDYRVAMEAAGVTATEFPHVQDYNAFPTWREPTMWGSVSAGYDLHLLSHKQIEFKQSRGSFVPYLAELSPSQGIHMNARTASELGIGEGDEVYVESHNAMTGETRSVKTKAVLRNTLRPDTVSMSHHYGLSATPTNAGQGPSPNELYFSGEGYIQCTQDASFHVMVRIQKA